MDSKQSKKRLTTIIIGTLVFCLAMFSILFYLDKTPGNKYYEHPNIFSQEYLKKYSATQTEKISLLWSYENFHNIDSPIISPDGKIILFMTTINEKPSLVCLNNEGHKMWVYSDFKRLDAQPHIKLRYIGHTLLGMLAILLRIIGCFTFLIFTVVCCGIKPSGACPFLLIPATQFLYRLTIRRSLWAIKNLIAMRIVLIL